MAERGNDQSFESSILEYFRSRNQNDRLLPTLPVWNESRESSARAGLADWFEVQGVQGQINRLGNGSIDWLYKGPKDDQEWAWMFNRQRYFLDWIVAYQQTSDPAFIKELSFHISDFVASNPYPGRLTFSAPWRPLEVARRIMESWIPAVYYLQKEEGLSDQAWLAVLQSVPDHADAMMNYHSFSGNHLITEMVALAKIAIFFPEYKEAQIWLDYAVKTAMEELFSQTYPDGSYKELSNHYQRVVLFSYEQFRKVLLEADRPRDYEKVSNRLSKMWDYFVRVMKPNGFGPINSDSDREHNEEIARPFMNQFKEVDWVEILTTRKANRGNELSVEASVYFEWAGHWVSRDDWGKHADWGFFDIGPHGTAHQHDDELHVSLSLRGDDFLVDTGRYWYVPGEIREYFAGSGGHNIVTVRGRDSEYPPNEVVEPIDNFVELREQWDAAMGRKTLRGSSLAERVEHTRTLIHWKGEGWIVLDQVLAMSPLRAKTRWHIHPDWEVLETRKGWQAMKKNGDIAFIKTVPSASQAQVIKGVDTPVRFAGWYSVDYNEREATPLLELEDIEEGSFYRTWTFSSNPDFEILSLDEREGEYFIELSQGASQKKFIINSKDHHVREE